MTMLMAMAWLWVAAAFTLRVTPRLKWPHLQGTDAFYHLAYIRLIRETGHRLPRRNPRIIGPGEHAYPALFHWLLSFVSPAGIRVLDRFGGLLCDACGAGLVAFFLMQLGQTAALSVFAAGLYLILPGLTLTHIGPRAYTLTPRCWAQLLFAVACFAALMAMQNTGAVNAWLTVAIAAVALMVLLSKFGVQTALLVLPVWALLAGEWIPLALLAGGAVLAFILFRGMFWRQCKGQFYHLRWYIKYNLDMLAHRSNWSAFPELLKNFDARGLAEALLWHNPVTSGFFRHLPLFIGVGVGLAQTSEDATLLYLLVLAALFPWLLTSFWVFRVFGEAERYLEFVAPMALVLLCWHHPGISDVVLFGGLALYCLVAQAANFWFLASAAANFSDADEAAVAAHLNTQPDARLLCCSDPESYYYLAHSDVELVKYNGDLSIEGAMEAYITHFFWRYPWLHPEHLEEIITRDRVSHILVNKAAAERLQAASGLSYSLSRFKPVLDTTRYCLYSVPRHS